MTNIIEVSFGGGAIAYVKVDTAYFYNNGILFKPTDLDLPASYQVHWADSPQATSTLETIGTSEGAPIPDDLWNRSRVIYGWIYLHPTEDSGVTAYEVRIYKNVRAGLPDGTEPTPSQQSTIDQLIGALNTAVEQTGQDAESASQSAQSAESAKTAAESARDTAGEYANDAESSAASASTSASQASTSATASAESAEQAAQIKMDVEALADDAQGYAESASQSASASAQSASASANSASDAQGYANSASASAQSASGYASNAQTSANTASTKATEASTSAQTASQKATEASQSASQALSYKTDAEQAKTASQTAQGLAESARDTAVSAKTDAESARDDAVQAKEDAESAVASIADALADKAPVITDTASGAIASFTDGADDLPLKSLVVDINPVQDLHGQDSPYPAGGGKNKFQTTAMSNTVNGTTFTVNADGSIRISGTPTVNINGNYVFGEVTLQAGSYKLNGNAYQNDAVRLTCYNVTTSSYIASFYNNQDVSFTLTETSTLRLFPFVATAYDGNAFTFYPMIRLASVTDATYAPYENICPISGWTQIGVSQSGVNVWDEEWELGAISTALGANQNSNVQIRSKNYIPVVSGEPYYVASAGQYMWIIPYDRNHNALSNAYLSSTTSNKASSVKDMEITIPRNVAYLRFYMLSQYGTTYNHDISINYPSTDHDYHPYTGRSITINLGQTVYGGKLDVLSGELTVYPYYASYNGETLTGEWISDRDKYVSGTTPTIGAQVVNIGAEGTEIQLEPHEVKSLLGANNLFADTGDTACEYRADTKLYINRLTKPDADMIADANITSGQYFMVGNSLYKATANIANGSAIVVGTNCIRKSLSEALNEINA